MNFWIQTLKCRLRLLFLHPTKYRYIEYQIHSMPRGWNSSPDDPLSEKEWKSITLHKAQLMAEGYATANGKNGYRVLGVISRYEDFDGTQFHIRYTYLYAIPGATLLKP